MATTLESQIAGQNARWPSEVIVEFLSYVTLRRPVSAKPSEAIQSAECNSSLGRLYPGVLGHMKIRRIEFVTDRRERQKCQSTCARRYLPCVAGVSGGSGCDQLAPSDIRGGRCNGKEHTRSSQQGDYVGILLIDGLQGQGMGSSSST